MKRKNFNLSNYKLLSCDMGELVPIGLQEVLPGDTFQHNTNLLLRVSPLLAPVMHPVRVRIHHFFVPTRLCWTSFEDFITGGEDGNNAAVFPTITLASAAEGSLADYLGVPPGVASLQVSAIPFRAYALIYNEFFRDQDLETEVGFVKTSGADATTNTTLQFADWEKDYFTSSRPWEQKGPAVSIPLTGNPTVIQKTGTTAFNTMRVASSNALTGAGSLATGADSSIETGAGVNLRMDPNGAWEADLATSSAVDITELREALALQRFEENRARYGARYTEYLRYLGIKSSDARLQRPEYLGGGVQTIQFSEVLATGETEDTPVGSLKGHGISAMKSNKYRRFFEEHGYVITLMSVLPKTMYTQGLHRTWNRRSKYDYFQRELQHIGQQEVLNKEIYAPHATPDGIFGYQDRYDEYRRSVSTVAGQFRSTLDFWHMARIFSSSPALNATFVKSNPTKRINAIQTEDVLWIMAKHKLIAKRQVSPNTQSFIK